MVKTSIPSTTSALFFSPELREVPRYVDMKDKKATSVLQRILLTCGAQSKEYGSCIAEKIPEVERDMCLKEFLALKQCMQNVLKRKA